MDESCDPDLAAVAGFYDNILALELLMGENLHLGYWPEGSGGSLSEAQHRLTDLIATSIRADSTSRVLDIGCGTGAPARRIALMTGAHITGVTISRQQAETASERSAAAGLAERTKFLIEDAMDLSLSDASFDRAFAIESIVHMPEKEHAMREIVRVLRPGGRLAIADVVLLPSQDVVGVQSAGESTFRLLAPETAESYGELVRDAGFEVEETRDLTDQTRPSYEHCVRRIQENRSALVAAIGSDRTTALDNLMSLFARTRQIGYLLLVAVKR
ncbi:SAM-dependent methyltransferase [Nocardia brasiliensis]|uniref:SAM-dependent methyltransferase n=1 Tax=Nocardia brasiliensis TaxID=37326 RepID=UPI003794B096